MKEDTFPFNFEALKPFNRKTQASKNVNKRVIQLVSITVFSIACTFICFDKINTKLLIK